MYFPITFQLPCPTNRVEALGKEREERERRGERKKEKGERKEEEKSKKSRKNPPHSTYPAHKTAIPSSLTFPSIERGATGPFESPRSSLALRPGLHYGRGYHPQSPRAPESLEVEPTARYDSARLTIDPETPLPQPYSMHLTIT